MDNGAYRTPGDLCLIPPRPGVSFAKTDDAETAIEHCVLKLPAGESRTISKCGGC